MGTTTTMQPTGRIRADGRAKVTGSGRYVADLTVAGMVHGAFRFAGVAHARIRRVDTTAARAVPGVQAVITAADVGSERHGIYVKDRTLFAHEVVRWEGEVVAAVAARTPEIARRAAALIDVEYELLAPVVDLEAALSPEAPLVHERWADYAVSGDVIRDGNEATRCAMVKGDAAAAMASAAHVVRSRYLADGSQPTPMEPRAILAEWTGTDVTIHSSTQVPFPARSHVAAMLGLTEAAVRVVVPLLGGGFGGKCEPHFEPHVAALARAAGRPVKVVFNRAEEFLAPDHRRERMVLEFESGVDADGRLIARRARLLIENGAYSADQPIATQLALHFAVGPYRVPNVEVSSHLVYTNTQPTGSVRAPSAPTVCWGLEQHLDEVAAAVGIDPVELRRRNLVREGDRTATNQVFDRIGAIECLDRALELIGSDRPTAPGEAIGVACAFWPSFPMASGAYLKLNADGSGTIITGAQENGSGSVMALPVLAARVLGMRAEDFSIVCQDTAVGPWDFGSAGSQTVFNNGRAVVAASEEVAAQLRRLAADELEASPDDIELVNGAARVRGTPTRSCPVADLAAKAHGTSLLLGRGSGEPPPIPSSDGSGCLGRLGGESFAAPTFAAHAVRVRVDRDTGVVRVLDVAAVQESGHIIDPDGAIGQVRGGVLMGIGQALSEAMIDGADGRRRNAHLLDYKLQTASDVPTIAVDFIDLPTPDAGPFGSKGVGEPCTVATPGAVSNGIARAAGVRVHELPATPERVWGAIHRAANGPSPDVLEVLP
jgi:CO/xanthine dehydrogenase Mo-binding subunit